MTVYHVEDYRTSDMDDGEAFRAAVAAAVSGGGGLIAWRGELQFEVEDDGVTPELAPNQDEFDRRMAEEGTRISVWPVEDDPNVQHEPVTT